jgi:chromosome partitioning protein
MRRIAFASEKGGVGKTTCALNVSVGLAKLGKRVLLCDVDPQGNASLVLTEGQGAEPPTLSNVLMGDASALDAIRPTRTPGLDILPSDVTLADAALAIADRIGREGRLRAALAEAEGSYDVVVLDTPPTRSLLTVNALCFASEVWIPVEPGLFSLSGLGQLQGAVEEVRKFLGHDVRVAGLVVVRTRNDRVSRDVEEQLRGLFPGLVCASTIPTSVKVEESHGRFQSVLDYAPRSPGAVAFKSLVEEIDGHGQVKRARASAKRTPPADDAAA